MDSNCTKCQSPHIYRDGLLWVCPVCAHEWVESEGPSAEADLGSESTDASVKDAHGQVLQDGDSVIVIKDLKIKGAGGGTIKGGTKVKNIRLSDAGDGHDIACKIPGFGSMNLKSEFVKKT